MDEDVSLEGSTGKNDSGSVWGDLLKGATDVATKGAAVYQQIKGAPPVKAAPSTTVLPSTGSGANWKQYLPYAIGAVVLLVVVGLVFNRR